MRAWGLSLALVLVACSSSSGSAGPPPPCQGVAPDQAEACFTNAYFQGYDAETAAPCPYFVPTTQKIGARREVDFFRSFAISDADVTTEGRFLQRYYAPYDLTFFTSRAAQVVAFQYALSGTTQEFQQASLDAGLTPGATPTAAQQARLDELVGNILFRDLRAFVASTSSPPATRVDVVVLEQIASPDVASEIASQGTIAGLGLSPTLFRNVAANDPNKNLFQALALPDDFTPTLFVGHRDILRLAKNAEVIVAHEMGHAMGLQHTQDAGNLMTQYGGDSACLPGLTADEVTALKSTASALGAGEGWQALLDAKASLVARLLKRYGGSP